MPAMNKRKEILFSGLLSGRLKWGNDWVDVFLELKGILGQVLQIRMLKALSRGLRSQYVKQDYDLKWVKINHEI